MNLASLETLGETQLQPAIGEWKVTSPVGMAPVRFFRRVVYLSFEIEDLADRIKVEREGATLQAEFLPYDYDALSPDEPALQASLTASDGALIITLDAPREVREVRLAPGTITDPAHYVELYRRAGSTLATEPTLSVDVQDGTALLPSDAPFTETSFVIRLKGPMGPVSLSTGDLALLGVRGYPTNPRLGIADPEDSDLPTFFWRALGGQAGAVPVENVELEAREALATALGRYLDDFFADLAVSTGDGPAPPMPESVVVALVAASDAPCALEVGSCNVPYNYVLGYYFDAEGNRKAEKQSIRFAGDQVSVRQISVRLPGDCTVRSAKIQTAESFRGDRPLYLDDGLPAALPVQKEGAHLGVERWVAQGIRPSRALSASGITVAVVALANDTEVLLELREDQSGQPSGRELVAGSMMLGQLGQPRWVTLLFPGAVVLSSDPHWILMKAAAGQAVWLARPGDTPARVLERPDNSPVWTQLSALGGLEAMYRFLSRSEQAQEDHVALAIGERVVEGSNEQGDRRVYDLTSAIDEYLNDLPPSSSEATVPLTVTSASRGILTVYPPDIEYELGGQA